MTKIFISHSSYDNAEAIALRDWLGQEGWPEIFLDVDPERGISAGERWERALNQAANRCEAVLFLVSRAWLHSDWCQKEFNLALRLNKRLFGVLVEDIPLVDLPVNLTSAWQLVNLVAGRDHLMFEVTLPVTQKEAFPTFSAEGLTRLRNGLKRAGLDPTAFAWPPPHELERAPYAGLKPLDADDAGIFFGREAAIVEALDRLRALRQAPPPRLLCVLGSSGSGKSSYLRAGLCPRLARDDREFLPLPVLRPERAAIDGRSGLIASLETAFRTAGLPVSRAELRRAVAEGPDTLGPYLSRLVEAARVVAVDDSGAAAQSPMLVVTVDQAEELFLGDGAAEGEKLLALLVALAKCEALPLAVVMAIRSDAFEKLQAAPALEGCAIQSMPFSPMPRGLYSTVIEGPAARMREANRPLTIEPALTRALLADMEEGGGRDALPLLAFTLERLWLEYGGRGVLSLSDYEELGRVRGSIETAVERALSAADQDPRIPADRGARLGLLRRAMVPWLAGIDPDSGQPRRRVARQSEVPEEARSLVELLIAQRLLSVDSDPVSGEATIEPAHEALLRQWGLLEGWLQEDFGLLATLEGVRRATRDWLANARDPAWLAHGAGRLKEAEKLSARADLAAQLGEAERDYLDHCRRKLEEEGRRERQRARQRRWLQQGSIAAGLLLSAFGAVAIWQGLEARHGKSTAERQRIVAETATADAERQRATAEAEKANADAFAEKARIQAELAQAKSEEAQRSEEGALRQLRSAQRSEAQSLTDRAMREREDGDAAAAIQAVLPALPHNLDIPERPFLAQAHGILARATGENRLLVSIPARNQINHAVFSPDGRQVVTSDRDGTVTIRDAVTGAVVKSFTEQRLAAFRTVFSANGSRMATAYQSPPSVIVRSVQDFAPVNDLRLAQTLGPYELALSPDGRMLATTNFVLGMRPTIWDLAESRELASLFGGGSGLDLVNEFRFAAGGELLALAMSDGFRIWTMPAGTVSLSSSPQGLAGGAADAAYLPPIDDEGGKIGRIALLPGDGALLLKGKQKLHKLVLADRKIERSWTYSLDWQASLVDVMLVTPEGDKAIVAASPTELSVHAIDQEGSTVPLRGPSSKIVAGAISPDGKLVAAAATDGKVHVWGIDGGSALFMARFGGGTITQLAFSSDSERLLVQGVRLAEIWDARPDHRRLQPVALPREWSVVQVDPTARMLLVTAALRPGSQTGINSSARRLGLFDVQSERLQEWPTSPDWPGSDSAVSFTRSGNAVLIARWTALSGGDGQAGRLASLGALIGAPSAMLGSAVSPDGRATEVRDVRDGRLLGLLPITNHAPEISPDRRFACFWQWVGGDLYEAVLWRLEDGRRTTLGPRAARAGRCRFGEGRFYVVKETAEPKALSVSGFALPDGERLFESGPFSLLDAEIVEVDQGRRLLISGHNRPPILLDAERGSTLALTLPSVGARSFYTSRDGRSVVIERFDAIEIWEAGQHRQLARHEGKHFEIAFSGNGERLALRDGQSGTTLIIELATGRTVTSIPRDGERGGGRETLDGTGARLATQIGDDRVRIVDVAGDRPARIVAPRGGETTAFRFVDRGERLITLSRDGRLSLWDTADGRQIGEWAATGWPRGVGALDSEERRLPVLMRDGSGLMLDLRQGEVLWRSADRDHSALAVTPDGRAVVVVRRGAIDIRDANGEVRGSIPFDGRSVNAIELDPAGKLAVVFVRSGVSALVDLTSARLLGVLPDLGCLQFSPSGPSELALCRQQLIEVRGADGTVKRSLPLGAGIETIAYHPAGGLLAIAKSDATVVVVGDDIAEPRIVARLRRPAASVGFSASRDELLVRESGKGVTAWATSGAERGVTFGGAWANADNDYSWRVRVNGERSRVAIRTPDNFIRILDAANGEALNWFAWDDKTYADLAFVDETMLATVTGEGDFELLDTARSRALKTVRLSGQFVNAHAGAIAVGGPRVLAWNEMGRIFAVSPVVADVTSLGGGPDRRQIAAAGSRDGSLFASIDEEGIFRLWDAASQATLIESRPFSGSFALLNIEIGFSSDQRHVYVRRGGGGTDAYLAVPPVREQLLATARARFDAAGAAAPSGPALPSGYRLGTVSADVVLPAAGIGPAQRGARIIEIVADSPAYQAGLRPGDVILRYGDQAIGSSADLAAAVRAGQARSLPVTIRRGERTLTIQIYFD